MILLTLTLLLVGPFMAVKYAFPSTSISDRAAVAFRVGLSVFFAFTGLGHFIKTSEMSLLLGDVVPFPWFVVQLTGVLELLAVVGLWLPRWRKATGCVLIVMLLSFLPINICAAFDRVPFGGHELGPIYLVLRVPFQFFVIWWTGKATAIRTMEHLWVGSNLKNTVITERKADEI